MHEKASSYRFQFNIQLFTFSVSKILMRQNGEWSN